MELVARTPFKPMPGADSIPSVKSLLVGVDKRTPAAAQRTRATSHQYAEVDFAKKYQILDASSEPDVQCG